MFTFEFDGIINWNVCKLGSAFLVTETLIDVCKYSILFVVLIN